MERVPTKAQVADGPSRKDHTLTDSLGFIQSGLDVTPLVERACKMAAMMDQATFERAKELETIAAKIYPRRS